MLLIASMGVLVRQFSCCMFSLFSGVMMILIVKFCCLLGLSVGPTDCRRSVSRKELNVGFCCTATVANGFSTACYRRPP